MRRGREIYGASADQSAKYAKVRVASITHPINLEETCTTPASSMISTALYIDSEKRVYRPREILTEMYNGKVTREDESERYILFDTYILPANWGKKNKEKNERNPYERRITIETDKGLPPVIGERVYFKLKRPVKKDDISIREFVGNVVEVKWGLYSRAHDDGTIETVSAPNQGLVVIQVSGRFPRSLILEPAYQIEKLKHPVGF